jgi:hypothetical protein
MCNWAKIGEGIVIGIGGGAGAGLVICGISYLKEKWLESKHKKQIYKWLKNGIKPENPKYTFRSTQTIASYTNLTKDRVRYICGIHPNIREIRGEDSKDNWTIVSRK